MTGPWGDRAGAVSITFDDGLGCQLTTAIPIMESHGLKGSFYMCPRDAWWEELAGDWAEAAARGHELGNHTYSHVCSSALFGGGQGLAHVLHHRPHLQP